MDRKSALACLPPILLDEFDTLSTDLTWLQAHWIVYRQLYKTSEQRIALLNETAPNLFFLAKRVLLDHVLLSLAKLTDPAEQSAGTNLTLERLVLLVEGMQKPELTHMLREHLGEFRDLCKPLRKHRHKRIAHRDLTVALASSAPLPDVTAETIEKALHVACQLLNAIEGAFCDSETDYEAISMLGDGDTLAWHLVQSKRYEELQGRGDISRDDIGNSSWHGA